MASPLGFHSARGEASGRRSVGIVSHLIRAPPAPPGAPYSLTGWVETDRNGANFSRTAVSARPPEEVSTTMKPWTLLGGCTAVVALLAASLPAQAQQGPIRIGASISVTGTYAKPGTYQREGYEVCADELNAKGGLLGRKVEFVLYDDQSMPATAVKLYEKLITEDKVDAVMGPYSSAVSEAVANVTKKY